MAHGFHCETYIGLSHTKVCIVLDTNFFNPADTAMKIQSALVVEYCYFMPV